MYGIIEGNNTVYTIGSGRNVKVVAELGGKKFMTMNLDGNPVDAGKAITSVNGVDSIGERQQQKCQHRKYHQQRKHR